MTAGALGRDDEEIVDRLRQPGVVARFERPPRDHGRDDGHRQQGADPGPHGHLPAEFAHRRQIHDEERQEPGHGGQGGDENGPPDLVEHAADAVVMVEMPHQKVYGVRRSERHQDDRQRGADQGERLAERAHQSHGPQDPESDRAQGEEAGFQGAQGQDDQHDDDEADPGRQPAQVALRSVGGGLGDERGAAVVHVDPGGPLEGVDDGADVLGGDLGGDPLAVHFGAQLQHQPRGRRVFGHQRSDEVILVEGGFAQAVQRRRIGGNRVGHDGHLIGAAGAVRLDDRELGHRRDVTNDRHRAQRFVQRPNVAQGLGGEEVVGLHADERHVNAAETIRDGHQTLDFGIALRQEPDDVVVVSQGKLGRGADGQKRDRDQDEATVFFAECCQREHSPRILPAPTKFDQRGQCPDKRRAVPALLKRDRPKRQRFTARTADGWKIALHRYVPANGTPRGQAPVFLCHGLGANRYNFDAPGRLSFAKWLCRHGFDCWLIELRGAGKSSKPSAFNRLKYSWTFDDYYRHDVPAALKLIHEKTGHRDVHWVGHSMGGMVAYAWLMTHEDTRVRSLSAVASPCFHHVDNRLFGRIVHLRKLLRYMPAVPYAGASALLVPAMPAFKVTVGKLFGNPANLSTIDLCKLISLAPENLPTSLIEQFANWYAEDGFRDPYGNRHYARQLHRITTPTLLLAGQIDALASPQDIAYVHDGLGTEDKKLMVFSRAGGTRHDYGHIDLILGRYAKDEVWPHILSWIQTH